MKVEHIYKIRDARGLNAYEKTFLFTVASHNEGMFATWQRNKDDMGMSKDTYYRTRASLVDRKLLTAQRRFDETTVYMINEEALYSLTENDSATQNDSLTENEGSHSHTENAHSLTENGHSLRPETKENMKVNKKENLIESADASSILIDKNDKDKEENNEGAPRPADPTLLIGDNQEEAVVQETTDEPHSLTENDDYYEWNGMKVLRADRLGFDLTAPVVEVVKQPCPKCSTLMDKNDMCWNFACA